MSIEDDRLTLIRSSIARCISDRENLKYAGSPPGDRTGDAYLTLLGPGPMGYFILEELLPLELKLRNIESLAKSGELDEARPLTKFDLELDRITAWLHDHLLNPILPFHPEVIDPAQLTPINKVYGEMLLASTFASSNTTAEDAGASSSSALLFKEDKDGIRIPTKAYNLYIEYEKQIEAATMELFDAKNKASANLIKKRIERLQSEWIILGKKHQIEAAIDKVKISEGNATFQDERIVWRDRFEAGRKKRSSAAGQTYNTARLVPISTVFKPIGDPGWQSISLSQSESLQIIDDSTVSLFSTVRQKLESATNGLNAISFEYLKCSINRDWLAPGFFEARFWRLPENSRPLSDGKGNGQIPSIPLAVFFIRNVVGSWRGEVSLKTGGRSPSDKISMHLQVPQKPKITGATKDHILKDKRFMSTKNILIAHNKLQQKQKTPRRKVKRVTPAAGSARLSRMAITALHAKVSPIMHVMPLKKTNKTPVNSPIRPGTHAWLIGSINASKSNQILLSSVALSFTVGRTKEFKPIRLTRQSNGKLNFSHKFFPAKIKNMNVNEYQIFLRHFETKANGDRKWKVVHSETILIAEKSRKVQRSWELFNETEEMIVAEAVAPHLYGYLCKLVPPCPNPDESLTWK